MGGLIAIGVLAIWFVVVGVITSKVAAGVSARWRWLFGTVFFCALLVLPVADEIIGGFQFRALCKEHASEFRLGVKDPQGRTTKLTFDPDDHYLQGTAIPIRHFRSQYHDVATGELVVAYDVYIAEGGLVARAISMSDKPIALGNSTCSPLRGEGAKLTFKFNVLD